MERTWYSWPSWMARWECGTPWWNSEHGYPQKYWWVILIYQLDSVKTTLVIINDTKQMNNVNMQNDGRAVELEFLKVLASDNFDPDRLKIAIFLFLIALKQRLKWFMQESFIELCIHSLRTCTWYVRVNLIGRTYTNSFENEQSLVFHFRNVQVVSN